jgi:CheY-like chemotaxis protein
MDVVGQLAGGIAHDFNNMLTGIIAAAECLKFTMVEQGSNLKMVNTIIGAANRSAELTRDLLSFSRKENSACSHVNVHQTIGCVTALLERTINKNILLKKELTAHHAYVVGDAGLLQNVLLNLGINARDAMPDSGTLTYATAEVLLDELSCRSHGVSLKPGNYLEISISDTGCGMTRATLKHIFEPFFTTKEVGKGTGLGLAAVYGTVSNLGGEIRVQSVPGLGTIFKIYLPLAPLHTVGEASHPAQSEEAITGAGGILLVDDEEIVRAVGCDLLEDLGYTVYPAADGEEALELLAGNRGSISLAILDLIMPKMGGEELFLRLREESPGLNVLFCTGYYRKGNDLELLQQGAKGLIYKPYNRIELSRAVSAAMGPGQYAPTTGTEV